jgi:hypothetical protein
LAANPLCSSHQEAIVAKSKPKDDDPRIMELARRGAQLHLEDLLHELDMLLELFPHLSDSFDPDELPVSFILKRGSERARRRARARGTRG